MVSAAGVLATVIFAMEFSSLLAFCPTSTKSFKRMSDLIGEQSKETASVYNAKSAVGCFSYCYRYSCQSYGIDLVKMKCYLYDFYVWHGGDTIAGTNMTYYWKFLKTCPDSYTYILSLNFCYKFHSEGKKWHHALDVCFQDGGLLVMVDSDAKLNILNKLTNNSGSDKVKYNDWKWLKGADVANFVTRRYRRCLIVKPNAGIVNEYCKQNLPFVCEIPVGA